MATSFMVAAAKNVDFPTFGFPMTPASMAAAFARDVITIRESPPAVPRLAVVGAGAAGIEAAKVAAGNGARVVLFEAGGRIPAPKRSWPSLLEAEGHRRTSREEASIASAGVEVQLNQRVSKVGEDLSVVAAGRRVQFDAVVLSTGSTPLPERFEGNRKTGVHVLDSQAAFAELGQRLSEYGKAVISGSGPVAVEVAEKLRSRRVAVSMLAPGGVLPTINSAPKRIVVDALRSWGVQIIDAKPEKVAGVDRVEAVVASGDVIPGDCFVVVPRLAPCVPEVQGELGRSGGLVVNERMQSSIRSVYAAGDCAELKVGKSTVSVMFESSAKLMGAVAGANASGRNASSVVVGSFFMELTGIAVASAGLGLAESVGLGLDVEEASKSWKGELACSLVYVKNTRTVVGAQVAGREVARFAGSLPIILAARMTIDQLAYQENPVSSDISPIAETAREGTAKQ
jgi:NADPH-dependent 2,4-dienoyl-CoA reductase/sulfur reductase-like enzyme